jgi:hypothetical protein
MAEGISFESFNLYDRLTPIVGRDPDELVELLSQIKTPIKIVAITSYGIKQVAYVMGDVRRQKKIKREMTNG